MIYYMYNHKADEISMDGVAGEKTKHVYPLMHYCDHCHAIIVGVWEFYGAWTSYYRNAEVPGYPNKFAMYNDLDLLNGTFLDGDYPDSDKKREAWAKQ